MDRWVGTKKLVFCRDYNLPILFRNLQGMLLSRTKRGTLQTRYPIGLRSGLLHRERSPYPPPGDALNSSVGVYPGKHHQYPRLVLAILF